MKKIENLVSQLGNQTLFLGDFNGHHPQWGSPSSDRRGQKISDIILNMNLALLNNSEPTCITTNGCISHIDLSMSTQIVACRYLWTTHPQFLSSFHYTIVIQDIVHNPHETATIKIPF